MFLFNVHSVKMSEANIKVTVKVRPLIRRERDNKLASQWRVTGDSIQHIEQLSEPFAFGMYCFRPNRLLILFALPLSSIFFLN